MIAPLGFLRKSNQNGRTNEWVTLLAQQYFRDRCKAVILSEAPASVVHGLMAGKL
jgi:hypothetical protein